MIAIIRNLELGIHNLSNSQFLFPSSKVRLQKKNITTVRQLTMVKKSLIQKDYEDV